MTDELKHYGVLGMKWGVRKDRKPQGYGNPKKKGKKQTRTQRALSNYKGAKSQYKKSRPESKTPNKVRTAIIVAGLAQVMIHGAHRVSDHIAYTKGSKLTSKLMTEAVNLKMDNSGFQKLMVDGQEIFKKVLI